VTAAFTCPAGHASTTGDYCDTCGEAIAPPTGRQPEPLVPAPVAPAAPSTAAATVTQCSNCGAARVADDMFCEVCGLDFATGKLPAPPPPPEPAAPGPEPAAPSGWTAVVEADRGFFAKNQAEGGATLTFPDGQQPREVPLAADEVQVGRGGTVDIDLDHVDPGVSHRHLRLVRRAAGDGWDVVDDGSANGTWLDDADEPIRLGEPVPVAAGSRIHIGAFTTITLRDDRGAPHD
jgi:FHA domain-containing protein